MDYPVLLTGQEVIALRLMLRITTNIGLQNKIEALFKAADFYMTSPQSKEEKDVFAKEATTTARRSLIDILDTNMALDFPLFSALVKNPNGTTVVNLSEGPFRALQTVARETYTLRAEPTENERNLHGVIQVNQPAILAAFELAEENVNRTPKPTQPPANGAN
ncbi:MAG: hypothetical protein M0000_07285 [Actinomycetota bacterium]|nr:hypothetical protein [Actinomycetota bacterium]